MLSKILPCWKPSSLLTLQFWIFKLRLRCKIMIVLSHIKNIDKILLQNVDGLDHNDCCF